MSRNENSLITKFSSKGKSINNKKIMIIVFLSGLSKYLSSYIPIKKNEKYSIDKIKNNLKLISDIFVK